MTKRVLLILATAVTLSITTMVVVRAQKSPRITGTYSNMHFNQEGGDVLGEEIKIVVAVSGYQGAVQFAEGVPSDLVVVGIKVDGTKINFSIPEPNPNACQFTGSIEHGVLKGQFRFKGGGSEDVELKKGKSYWD